MHVCGRSGPATLQRVAAALPELGLAKHCWMHVCGSASAVSPKAAAVLPGAPQALSGDKGTTGFEKEGL